MVSNINSVLKTAGDPPGPMLPHRVLEMPEPQSPLKPPQTTRAGHGNQLHWDVDLLQRVASQALGSKPFG